MLLGILKGIIALWPFLKELVLGNQEFRNHVRRNKVSTFLMVALVIMFLLFLFIADAAIEANKGLQEAQHEIKVLEVRLEGLRTTTHDLEADKTEFKTRLDALEREKEALKSANEELIAKLLVSEGKHTQDTKTAQTTNQAEPRPRYTPSASVGPTVRYAPRKIKPSRISDGLEELRELEGGE